MSKRQYSSGDRVRVTSATKPIHGGSVDVSDELGTVEMTADQIDSWKGYAAGVVLDRYPESLIAFYAREIEPA